MNLWHVHTSQSHSLKWERHDFSLRHPTLDTYTASLGHTHAIHSPPCPTPLAHSPRVSHCTTCTLIHSAAPPCPHSLSIHQFPLCQVISSLFLAASTPKVRFPHWLLWWDRSFLPPTSSLEGKAAYGRRIPECFGPSFNWPGMRKLWARLRVFIWRNLMDPVTVH